ncbi:hypothetical protein PoB_002969600 [Plakobranchus ocellatus]|uniref:Uncharacterized protein n=1 Tax=Plakobranchus ocellatus TaxID=259542 RepID=A0AAV3ZW60_9GAST|nr:hypothetical protein PoB_002969600 [Plakobranchus ocellatus]
MVLTAEKKLKLDLLDFLLKATSEKDSKKEPSLGAAWAIYHLQLNLWIGASESALRSAGTLLSRVRTPPPAPWPDGGPKSLRSPCCGLAIYKNQTF